MWEYEHKVNPRARSIRVSIHASGRLRVSTPKHVSDRQIQAFLEAHTDWIEKQVQVIRARPRLAPPGSVSIFGKVFLISVESQPKQPYGTRVEGGKLRLNSPLPGQSIDSPQVKTQLNRFLKLTATHYITERVTQLAQVMSTSFSSISLREQSSRWGSCSSRGSLNFNWRLVHFPTEVIDYVIIHELAHRTHLNHSRAFWNLVAKFDPEYKKHQGWLKRNGQGYELA